MSGPIVTEEQIVEALRPVEDPELHRSIVDLGMLRGVSIMENGVVGILIALTVPGCPLKAEIEKRVSTLPHSSTASSRSISNSLS